MELGTMWKVGFVPNSNALNWIVPYSSVSNLNCASFQDHQSKLCLSPITQNWSVPNSNLPQWLVPYSNVPKLNCALFQCPTIELCLVPMPSKWIVPYSNVAKWNVPYSNAIKLSCALFQYHKMKCALFLFHQIEMCHSRINVVWMMREGTGDLALTYLRSFLSWRKWKCLL